MSGRRCQFAKASFARLPVKEVSISPEEFARLRRRVRRAADLPVGVRVRVILDPDIDSAYLGWCQKTAENRFEIHIAAHLSYYFTSWVLQHEYAHCRQSLIHGEDVPVHGAEFGVEWAYVHARYVRDRDSWTER